MGHGINMHLFGHFICSLACEYRNLWVFACGLCSVRLKSRFGSGYRVRVARTDAAGCDAVRRFFTERKGAVAAEETTGGYVRFALPGLNDSDMAVLLAKLQPACADGRRGIDKGGDIQLGMSSLEDVFLRIARETEVAAARREGLTTEVMLRTGESVRVPVGAEETLTSPQVPYCSSLR